MLFRSVKRPRCLAVGSPSMFATQPCETSWKTIAMTSGTIQDAAFSSRLSVNLHSLLARHALGRRAMALHRAKILHKSPIAAISLKCEVVHILALRPAFSKG